MTHITREMKFEAARREVGMRRRVYPHRVAEGKMTPDEADRQIRIMEAIVKDYAPVADMFGGGDGT